MKKFLLFCYFLILSTLSINSFAELSSEEFHEAYVEARSLIQAGDFAGLSRVSAKLIDQESEFDWLLNLDGADEEWLEDDFFWLARSSDWADDPHTPESTPVLDVAFNMGLMAMSGPQLEYFLQKANIEETQTKNLLKIFGLALKNGYIGDTKISEAEREGFYRASVNELISAANSSHWQGNHEDSYNYDAPQKLVYVYAFMAPEFGEQYSVDYLEADTLPSLQARNLGADELWQEPLDILAEVVRRSHYLQNSLYKKISSRDYFFFIQDHFARVFGAEDVEDQVEFSVGVVDDHRAVIMVCNANSIWMSNNVHSNSGDSLLMTTLITSWSTFTEAGILRCGGKNYNVQTESENFSANAPEPSIVRVDPAIHSDGFNIVLSYVYYDNLPEEVVQNLIGAMVEEAGFEYQGEEEIEDSKEALIDALTDADMFYRIGHVQGDNLNISFNQGRELKFTKEQDNGDGTSTTINYRVQIPLPEHTGETRISREELSEVLWERARLGRSQSLFAMGIACNSHRYIDTWMDAYFEAVMNHTAELNIDESGRIEGFTPPFVVGAQNTFNSSTHREDRDGLESYLQIILISMNYTVDPRPAFADQDVLRNAMFEALENNSTPYIADSNYEREHTRQMTHRLNIVLRHEEEVIDRVF